MAGRRDPFALRWLVGVELCAHRRRAGLTLAELSVATGITKPKLGHMEVGRYQHNPDDVAAVLRACGADGSTVDRLAALSRRNGSKSWWAPWAGVLPDWLKTFAGLEGMAEAEFGYQPTVLPSLVQTEDYARALTGSAGFVRRVHSERFVSFHLARAARLSGADPLRLHFVVGEAALRLAVGAPDVRRAQYEHLLEVTEQDNATLQVLTPDCGPHDAGGTGQFAVLHFADARPVAYTEQLDAAVYVHDPDEVGTYALAAQNLQRVALDPDDSAALVKALIAET